MANSAIQLDAELQSQLLIRHAKCVLALTGVRCEYFEECVMPMGSTDWPGLGTPKEHQEFAEGVKQYQRSANVGSQKRRLCSCGRELEHGKQLCYVCRNQRRAETKRQAKAGAEACMGVFLALDKIGAMQEPAVHYAAAGTDAGEAAGLGPAAPKGKAKAPRAEKPADEPVTADSEIPQ